MTLAEFFEWTVKESRKLEIELETYQSVFAGVKSAIANHLANNPDDTLIKKLALTPELLDASVGQSRHVPHLHATTIAKYQRILDRLHPDGAVSPTLTQV
jgi:hypothetical protein